MFVGNDSVSVGAGVIDGAGRCVAVGTGPSDVGGVVPVGSGILVGVGSDVFGGATVAVAVSTATALSVGRCTVTLGLSAVLGSESVQARGAIARRKNDPPRITRELDLIHCFNVNTF